VAFDHLILLGGWILFGFLHSFFAGKWFTGICQKAMGRWSAYYRPLYSIIAFVNLAVVLAWQFSIATITIASFPVLKWVVGIPLGGIGLYFFLESIRKYFFHLSGVAVLWRKSRAPFLELSGIHRYVRHPLYLGTLIMIWVAFLFFPLLNNLIACIMITLYTLIGIRFEERKLLGQFGESYAAYRQRTPMLIPKMMYFNALFNALWARTR
jgi:protein-S-isoprenylcysteine O-methyltransferase Ste14